MCGAVIVRRGVLGAGLLATCSEQVIQHDDVRASAIFFSLSLSHINVHSVQSTHMRKGERENTAERRIEPFSTQLLRFSSPSSLRLDTPLLCSSSRLLVPFISLCHPYQVESYAERRRETEMNGEKR